MQLYSIRHDWPELAGFLISRPKGLPEYTFLHFVHPIRLRIREQTVLTKPGACIFYRPDTPQWFYSESDVLHNWAHFHPDLTEKLQRYNIPQDTILYPGDCAFISDIFRLLELEYFSENQYREQLIEHLTEEFLLRFARAIRTEQPLSLNDRKEKLLLRKLRMQILSAPEEKWTVARMAQLMHLSSSRFHAVYKLLFGTSPMQDVIEARITRAKSLLLSEQELDVAQLAERLGYNDQYHFIRQFKNLTGQTPGAYRKSRG